MVRQGQVEDMAEIVLLAAEFWKCTDYEEELCVTTILAVAEECVNQGLMAVLEIDYQVVGFACGVKGALLGNAAVATGTEIAWWVDPEYRGGTGGIGLLKKLESLAKKQGIKYWTMVYLESSMPDIIPSLYERAGYTKSETSYTRIL